MRETKKSKIVVKNALNKKGKNASMKSKHISQTFRAFLLSIYFSKIISEIHAFKSNQNKKAGVRGGDNNNAVHFETPARQEVGLWQKERTVKLL